MHVALGRAMSFTSPPSLRLILVRHGEVEARWRGTIYGRLDVPLSDRGLEQSALVAERLEREHLDAVLSSGLQRAEAAAALIRASRVGVEREDDPRLTELDRGDWAGRRITELTEVFPEAMGRWTAARGAIQAPGGESPAALATRTVPVFEELAARFPGGTVAVVAHLWVVRSALAACLGLPMERSSQVGLPPGGICELSWPSGSQSSPGSLGSPGRSPRLVRLGV